MILVTFLVSDMPHRLTHQNVIDFLKDKGYNSIPHILNMQGQVARCYAETCFQEFVSNNVQRLRGLSEADLIKAFCWAQTEPEARLCVYWHGRSAEQAADGSRGKDAQGWYRLTKQRTEQSRKQSSLGLYSALLELHGPHLICRGS